MFEFEIYVHIPFCVRKCNYCDFLSFQASDGMMSEYVQALLRQIEEESPIYHDGRVVSIYFGGGTPSILSSGQLGAILAAIKTKFTLNDDCEITIEVNPGTVDLCKLAAIKEAGFNRISIGMQSMNDEELKELGRIHDRDSFLECFNNARTAGFENINVDIMTALPGQNIDKLMATLDEVISLKAEHISAYSLIIEEGTVFYERYAGLEDGIMSEEAERQLYWACVNRLKKAGYTHYEISNFAKAGYESRHNLGYWRRRPYLGLGLGASSLVSHLADGYVKMDEFSHNRPFKASSGEVRDAGIRESDNIQVRVKNITSIREYLMNPVKKEETTSLKRSNQMEEFMFLGLRCLEGIREEDFKNEFGTEIDELYGKTIRKLQLEGMLERSAGNIRLTDMGVDYGNYVFSEFLI